MANLPITLGDGDVVDLGDATPLPRPHDRYTGTYVDCVILGSLDYVMLHAGQRSQKQKKETSHVDNDPLRIL